MARVVAALDGGDSLDNEIYAQKCAAALEALEAELADQDRRFATIRETLSLTAESLEALSGAEDATLPPDLEDDDGGAARRRARALELAFDGPLGVRASLMRDKDRKTTHVIVDEVLGACPHAGEVAALDEIAAVAGEPSTRTRGAAPAPRAATRPSTPRARSAAS
ncbi:hypothetical protein SO694_00200019 [Aureococcus anophagefferens]|uniref:Uncharacterized protein n=1 Tax=Aureococcus anophagefferens TaxID=44056 RepID=A0ABR1FNT8_AURAN